MAYSTLPDVTASQATRASWGQNVKANQEDHETRTSDLETSATDHESRLDALEAGSANFDGLVRFAELALTSPELLALRATPKTLVAAPGAGKMLVFKGIELVLDATATAYVESAANLGVRYENGSGAKVSDDIEATGFIDQTADTATYGRPKADPIVAKTGSENKALVLHNLGAGEYTTGTGVLRAKVWYSVVSTGW